MQKKEQEFTVYAEKLKKECTLKDVVNEKLALENSNKISELNSKIQQMS